MTDWSARALSGSMGLAHGSGMSPREDCMPCTLVGGMFSSSAAARAWASPSSSVSMGCGARERDDRLWLVRYEVTCVCAIFLIEGAVAVPHSAPDSVAMLEVLEPARARLELVLRETHGVTELPRFSPEQLVGKDLAGFGSVLDPVLETAFQHWELRWPCKTSV